VLSSSSDTIDASRDPLTLDEITKIFETAPLLQTEKCLKLIGFTHKSIENFQSNGEEVV